MAETSDTPSETLREWARDDRVTLAIVFTDIVGSTALGRELGDEQMNDVRRAHFGRSRALLAQHTGREIKTIGDSVMAVFRSIGAALDYAHALHLDPGHAELQARGVRAGIHIGSVDVVEEDIFGTEVAVAARVVGGIEGAEIWLSDQAKRDLERAGARRHSGMQWLPHDGVELKGIGTERLWSLVPGVAPAGAAPPVPETGASSGPAWVEGPASDQRGMTRDATRPRHFAFGPFRLFPAQQLLLEGEAPVRLGGRAWDLLIALIEKAGQVITKEALSARLWPNIVVEEGALRVHVAALRKALRDGQEGRRYIANIAGRGYSFAGEVVATDEPGTTATAPPKPTPPLSVARLFGRAEVVETLSTRLAQQRLITITGPGGIGKTSVGLAVADRMRPGLPDGVCLIDFAPLADSRLVPTALASALGIGVVSENPLPSLVALLRNREMLIVLDNCEHVIDAAALLAESLLQGSARLRILATSREPMRVPGEILFRLAPLAIPEVSDGLTAPIAMAYSAVQLFVERAAMCLGEFSLTDAHAPAVANICRRLDGIPLAIEMAAGRVDVFGIAGLAGVLDDRFRLAMHGRRTALPRQQTLRAAIDWSYDLLPEAEQIVLRRLAVFRGAFSMNAAVAVATDGRITAADAIEGVANLAEKSLITTDITSNITRHRLLNTTRAYALEKLAESGEAEEAARRSATYFRDLCAPPPPGSKSRLSNDQLTLRAREIDNVRAALDWCFSAAGDSALGVDLTASYAPIWLHLSLMQECRERCERALQGLEPASAAHARLQMWLQIDLAVSLFDTMGSARQARDLLTKALDAAETLGDFDAQAGALASLVANYIFQAELSEARMAAERLAEVAHRIGDPAVIRMSDRLMGTALVMLGKPRDGQRFLERFLEAHPSTADLERPMWYPADHRAAARAFLARALWLQGMLDRAYNEAQASLDDLKTADHELLLCRVLYFGMCRIAPSAGRLEAAEQSIARLIAAATRLNAPFWQTAGHLLTGKLMIERGAFAQGVAVLREPLDTCRRTGWRMSYPEFNGALATGLAGLGQIDEALDAVNEGLTAADRGADGHDLYLAEALRVKGEVLLLHEDPAAAEDCFRDALDVAAKQQALLWQLRVALSFARLRVTERRAVEARQLLATVYDRFTEGFDAPDLRAAKALLDTLG
jgi:predicted ATPase/DNA-binding winged helix-turn-helix (wHTH) protein/class 3 adenylate cyclase